MFQPPRPHVPTPQILLTYARSVTIVARTPVPEGENNKHSTSNVMEEELRQEREWPDNDDG